MTFPSLLPPQGPPRYYLYYKNTATSAAAAAYATTAADTSHFSTKDNNRVLKYVVIIILKHQNAITAQVWPRHDDFTVNETERKLCTTTKEFSVIVQLLTSTIWLVPEEKIVPSGG